MLPSLFGVGSSIYALKIIFRLSLVIPTISKYSPDFGFLLKKRPFMASVKFSF
jgi:hypothetical protein